MSYEISRTNGGYSGLSNYYGLGNGEGKKGKGHKKGPPLFPGKGHAYGKRRGESRERPFPAPDILEQRSIRAGQKSERVEQRAEAALTRGEDSLAAGLFKRAEALESKSQKLGAKAQALRLPYADDPMMPRGLMQKADADVVDTPVKIADQLAPMPQAAPLPPPESAPVPTTAPPTTPAAVPTTLPLTPPPVLLPGLPMAYGPPRAPGPMPQMPPQMMAPPPRRLPMGLSPANAAAATAALAASYFLFF